MALRKPPLRDVHADRGAKFTAFGGWDMPVQFDSITTEHRAVRERAGRFDVSHMGEVAVSGPDAETLMQRLTTNDVTALAAGEGQYAAITDADGIMLDDTVVYRLPSDHADDYLFVPNAGHDDAMHERWITHRNEWGLECTVQNATERYAMFAIQGPDAVGTTAATAATPATVRDLARFEIITATLAGVDALVARTGYTGEDGVEVLVPWEQARTVWDAIECQPCGLGARDTLRIEQGYLLSGQDFDPEAQPRTPYEAGIGFVVSDTDFLGHEALATAEARSPAERFVGLELLERGVPRHGYDIVDDADHVIGTVTSGTATPTLPRPVGLGYVPSSRSDPGTEVGVVVRGERKRARIAAVPFDREGG